MKWTFKRIVAVVVFLALAGAAAYAEGPSWWELTREELRAELGRPGRIEERFDVYLMPFYSKADVVYVYYDGEEMSGIAVLTRPEYLELIVRGFRDLYGDWDHGYPENRNGFIWYLPTRTVDVSYYDGIVSVSIRHAGL